MHYHIHYHQSFYACQPLMVNLKKTAKSKLQEVVLKESDSTIVNNPQKVVAESRHNSTYIVDLMTVLRSLVQIPEKYEALT